MKQETKNVLDQLRSNSAIGGFDEASTKQFVIMRILTTLGWDQFDANEVIPEYDVGGIRVDYALRTGGTNKVLLEAKRAGESLEHHQEQLLGYAFRHGVELAVLTNGLTWWIYLPMRSQESWEQRLFCIVDIQGDDVEVSVDRFVEFLSRSRVHDGSAVQDATNRLDTLRRESEIWNALPKAWNSLIAEKDDLLVELIGEKVESLLGFSPGTEPIHHFLGDLAESSPSDMPPPQVGSPLSSAGRQAASRRLSRGGGSAGRRRRTAPTGFTFDGESFRVNQWNSLIQTLAEVLYRRHPDDFSKVETVLGAYISRNDQDFRAPREVSDSGYFVETHLSGKATAIRCSRLVRVFGYDEQDLKIDII